VSTQDKRILEAIDACRTGSDDLSMPELHELAGRIEQDADVQALFDQSQRLDAMIGEAFEEVPVPNGLAEQISASLGAMDAAGDVDTSGHSLIEQSERDEDESAVVNRPVVQNSPVASRAAFLKWVAVAASIAACFTVAVGAVHFFTPREMEVEAFTKEARQWINDLQQNPWKLDLDAPLPSHYNIEPSVVIAPRGWQQLEVPYGSKAVAFDLRKNEGSPFAALVVFDTYDGIEKVGSVLSPVPLSNTGNVCIGACKVENTLYVLIVEGNVDQYRRFIKSQLPPV